MSEWMIGSLGSEFDKDRRWGNLNFALSTAIMNGHGDLYIFRRTEGQNWVSFIPAKDTLLKFGRQCIIEALPIWKEQPADVLPYFKSGGRGRPKRYRKWIYPYIAEWATMPEADRSVVTAIIQYVAALDGNNWNMAVDIHSLHHYVVKALAISRTGPPPEWEYREGYTYQQWKVDHDRWVSAGLQWTAAAQRWAEERLEKIVTAEFRRRF